MVHNQSTPGDSTSVAVITVSDRSSRGERADLSGPRAMELLNEQGYSATLTVIPDGIDSVTGAIRAAIESGARVVITSGGTGIAPRDLTPEGTRPLLTRELPGIAEALRREGARNTGTAVLSRGLAGISDSTLVVNLPGSVKAVEEGLTVLLPLIAHIVDQLDGGDH
jgi:molybdenum cofactor synthesis domain-containing protein